jgi:CTP:molybdopterin cytidylyltransferase MocA
VGARAVLEHVQVREFELGNLCEAADVDTPQDLE